MPRRQTQKEIMKKRLIKPDENFFDKEIDKIEREEEQKKNDFDNQIG